MNGKHSQLILVCLIALALSHNQTFAQSGSRNAIPGGGGGSVGGSFGGGGGGSFGGGGSLGGLAPNINGGFSLPVSSGGVITAADTRRQQLLRYQQATAQARQNAILQSEFKRQLEYQQLVRRSQLQLQAQKRRTERDARRAEERDERIEARKARMEQGFPKSSLVQTGTPTIDMTDRIQWPAALKSNTFVRQTSIIDRLVANRNESGHELIEQQVAVLRSLIGRNARTLGSRDYTITRRFVEQLRTDIWHHNFDKSLRMAGVM